jgi:hypothetical protein
METKFQTSFIPKKPLVPVGGAAAPVKHHHAASLLMTIAVFIFLASLLAAAGSYLWKGYLVGAQESYKKQLADHERRFNVDLIDELKRANVRIDLATKLLSSHVSTSQIFDVISRLTITKVRFNTLELTSTTEGIKVDMKGEGTNLSAVAFQSDVLGQLEQYGLRKVVKNPILADPSLDPDGKVSFSFSAYIDPSTVTYAKAVHGQAGIDTGTTATSTTP